jgi:hypothetical protein
LPIPSKIVTVVCQDFHFVALLLEVNKKTITVFDGLCQPLSKWLDAACYLLRKLGLIDIASKDLGSFMLDRGKYIKQHDGYNCGPIVCSYIWDTLSMENYRVQFTQGMSYGVKSWTNMKKW